MIKVKKASKLFNGKKVLNNISFNIEKGHKIALVGSNGAGKTTLLRLLKGEILPEKGKIEVQKKIRIAYLPQDPRIHHEELVNDYIINYSKWTKDSDHQDSATFHRNIEIMFSGFNLSNNTKNKKIKDLSSGQKTKIFLSAILLSNPDIILLDEPTNNLDLPALIWLENFLSQKEMTFLVVSHDQTFLDNVCNKVFEIIDDTKNLEISNGKYSDYLLNKQKKLSRQKLKYRDQQEEIFRLDTLVRTKKKKAAQGAKFETKDNDKISRGFFRNRASNSLRDAKVIKHRIEKIDRIEKPAEKDKLKIDILPDNSGADRNIYLRHLVCGYDDGFRIGPFDLDIMFGQQILILGLNGEGKSTLLKTITGQIPSISGEVLIGSGVRIGNLTQEHENLVYNLTAYKYLRQKTEHYPEFNKSILFNHLKKFGFDEKQIKIKIENLSPGARSRLLLAYFAIENVNTLVLDEPTNHLDLDAAEALAETVKNFKGTIIIVTHNRFFVQKILSGDIYVLANGVLNRISDFNRYVDNMAKKSRKMIRILRFK